MNFYAGAVPANILGVMNVEGLTRGHIASHLQVFKYCCIVIVIWYVILHIYDVSNNTFLKLKPIYLYGKMCLQNK